MTGEGGEKPAHRNLSGEDLKRMKEEQMNRAIEGNVVSRSVRDEVYIRDKAAKQEAARRAEEQKSQE